MFLFLFFWGFWFFCFFLGGWFFWGAEDPFSRVARAHAHHEIPPRVAPAGHARVVRVLPVRHGLVLADPQTRDRVEIAPAGGKPVTHAVVVLPLLVIKLRVVVLLQPAPLERVERDALAVRFAPLCAVRTPHPRSGACFGAASPHSTKHVVRLSARPACK